MSRFNVVLVADRIADHTGANISSRTLEFTEDPYFDTITGALARLAGDLKIYANPNAFLENIQKHRNDVIFPIWSGTNSRNRKALLPSICEAYGLAYVGADTYAQIVCQDKVLTKHFLRKVGLSFPRYVLIESERDLANIRRLQLPCVVKPNFEGGSIGITRHNLVSTSAKGRQLARLLLKEFSQPILVEEFAVGREVSIVLTGTADRVLIAQAIETEIVEPKIDLSSTIFSLELKKRDAVKIESQNVSSDFPQRELAKAQELFRMLGKVDLLRIDGRWFNEVFTVIELSPDVYLGPDSTVEEAAKTKGWTYDDLVWNLIQIARDPAGFESASK